MNVKILSMVLIGLLTVGCSSDKGAAMKILAESCKEDSKMSVTTGIGVFGNYAEAVCEWKVKKDRSPNQ